MAVVDPKKPERPPGRPEGPPPGRPEGPPPGRPEGPPPGRPEGPPGAPPERPPPVGGGGGSLQDRLDRHKRIRDDLDAEFSTTTHTDADGVDRIEIEVRVPGMAGRIRKAFPPNRVLSNDAIDYIAADLKRMADLAEQYAKLGGVGPLLEPDDEEPEDDTETPDS